MVTGMCQAWQAELVERHRRLFGAFADPTSARGYPTCGAGWQDVLDRCCVRIENALLEGDEFAIDEIKSKYATLRFDWIGNVPPATARKIDEAVNLAEARSACSCEVCGDEGGLYTNGGWLTTLCRSHASGQPVAVDPDLENLYVTRVFDECSVKIAACRRYLRDTDSFVDVDPASVGIEE